MIAERVLGPKSTHTLILRCPPTYAQLEPMSIYEAQMQILLEYRTILHGFEDISIRGPSTGWESGLYTAVLRDIRSIKELPEFIDDLRDLEREGYEILQQTGDPEAADVSWTRAIAICHVARQTSCISRGSFPISRRELQSNAFKLYNERWVRLRREKGDKCAVPVIELWYKLITKRLSGVLQLIQKGGHLATRHRWAPRPIPHYVNFVSTSYSTSNEIGKYFQVDGWSPRPFEEAQLCFTVATLFRLLDTSAKAATAYATIRRAAELAPNDELIQQERERVETWARSLVQQRTLGLLSQVLLEELLNNG